LFQVFIVANFTAISMFCQGCVKTVTGGIGIRE
jgi:copper chaperone CopZ